MDLSKSVALITGGAQGIGRGVTEKLLEEGAKVVVADINADVGKQFECDMVKKHGENRCKFIKCDVSDSEQLSRIFKETVSTFGSLNIVFNNAAIYSSDPAKAKKMININLSAVIEGTYHAIDLMSKKNGGNGGVVINTSSVVGLQIATDALAVYTATKHGVVAFTRSVQTMANFKEQDVRVNCLCPQLCDTDMAPQVATDFPPEIREEILKRKIKVKDVVDAFMFCINDNTMNGEAVGVFRGPDIFRVEFPKFSIDFDK